MPDAADLVAHARETRAVVIGAAGAVAALECAKVGMTVTIFDDAGLSGPPETADLGGVAVDVDADGFAADVPAFAALVAELGLDDRLEPLRPARTGIADLSAPSPQRPPIPLPAEELLGIPANVWDPAARRVIGWTGTWRAYLDRVRPPLTIGRERNLAALVRSRMGDRVCERLVAPVTRARWGLDPSEVDVEAAARGLNGALTRAGSLAGAVAEIVADGRDDGVVFDDPGAWAAALTARLRDLGGHVRTGARVRSIAREGGAWRIDVDETAAGVEVTATGDPGSAASSVVTADIVIVAAGEEGSRRLLAPVTALPEVGTTAPEDVVLLRVRAGAASEGTFSELVSSTGTVRRVVDLTATHPSLARALGSDDRIVYVTAAASDAADLVSVEVARAAASVVLGAPIADADVVAAQRVRRAGTVPAVRLGAAEEVGALRSAVAAIPGLGLTGAWISGGGRADVVADAVAEAVRLRRQVLWGDGAEGTS